MAEQTVNDQLDVLLERIEVDPEAFMNDVNNEAAYTERRFERTPYNQTRGAKLYERIQNDPETFMVSVAFHAAQSLDGGRNERNYSTFSTERTVALQSARLALELVPLVQNDAAVFELVPNESPVNTHGTKDIAGGAI